MLTVLYVDTRYFLVSAKNFEENDLYIQYFVELPPGK